MEIYSLVLLLIFGFFLEPGSAKVRNDCACGESNLKASGRIVNGKPTTPHRYPWMVALFTPRDFMCGGAIISDKTILTAGHCVFYNDNILQNYVVLGMHEKGKDGVVYNIAHAILHPKFKNHTIYDDYDMAMIAVTKRIRFGHYVRPICLPEPYEDFSGQAGIVAGWGRLGEEKEALMATVLMETKIRVKPNKECATEVARLLTFNEESMICGYEFSHDACQGDSGGPFFIENGPNRYEVFGVVSFGDGCARRFPGVYGRVTEPKTLQWIHQYTSDFKGDFCSDTKESTDEIQQPTSQIQFPTPLQPPRNSQQRPKQFQSQKPSWKMPPTFSDWGIF